MGPPGLVTPKLEPVYGFSAGFEEDVLEILDTEVRL